MMIRLSYKCKRLWLKYLYFFISYLLPDLFSFVFAVYLGFEYSKTHQISLIFGAILFVLYAFYGFWKLYVYHIGSKTLYFDKDYLYVGNNNSDLKQFPVSNVLKIKGYRNYHYVLHIKENGKVKKYYFLNTLFRWYGETDNMKQFKKIISNVRTS